MTTIHPTAVVSPTAVLAEGVEIGPYSIIGPTVTIRENTVIGPHVVIDGVTEIGKNCHIFQFASIGAVPQDLKFSGERYKIVIGDNNRIREFVTIHSAIDSDIRMTAIGNNNLIMAYCHIAHNCKLDDNIVMGNVAQLAGHVHVEDYAIISGLTGVHQFTRIGCHSFVGGASAVTQDVPPYVTAAGNRAGLHGLNLVGLERRGFSAQTLRALKKTYKIVFRSSLRLVDAVEKIKRDVEPCPEVEHFIRFISTSERGVCR